MDLRQQRGVLGWLAVVLAVAAGLAIRGSATSPKFYPDDPVWEEVETEDASAAQKWEPDLLYDFVLNLFAKPGDADFDRRAMNVNTVDEVPNGNWFVNRAGTRPLTPEEVTRAPNTDNGPAGGTWTVVSAKSDGVTPGFTVKDPAGAVWFLKFDPPGHRAMATGTEVVAAKLFWALGYHTAEYHIAKLRREALVIGDTATIRPPGANRRRLKSGDIDWLLSQARRDADGGYRVIASRELAGKDLGRFNFYGTRPDDPNDVIPHEHRRELRGYGVFAAWLNHVDAKSINTMDTLVTESGRSVVRHHLLDFGSALGSASVAPRDYWEGDEYFVEPLAVGKGMAGFGFPIPTWRTKKVHEAPSIGRLDLDNARWDPEAWKPHVPNAAFLRARADDKFWAARKAMAITDDMIRAAVKTGAFGDPSAEAFLIKALIDRRDAIGRRYLVAINPIVDPALDQSGTLTFANAAVAAGVSAAPGRYKAVWSIFDNATGESKSIGETTSTDARVQAPAGVPDAPGAFVKIALSATGGSPSWEQPVQAYFRRTPGGWKLVGFERMP